MNNNTVSSRQAVLMTVTTVFSPAVRLFSSFSSGKADRFSWVAVFISMGLALCFLPFLNSLINRNMSFTGLTEKCFGKAVSKISAVIYIVFGLLVSAMHLRYYAMRVSGTVYNDISIDVFVLIMACICVYALYFGIGTVGRINEITFIIVTAVSVILLSLLTPGIKHEALAPTDSFNGILHTASFISASYGYLTLSLVFGNSLKAKESFFKYSFGAILSGSALLLWLFWAVLGNLGTVIVEKLPYPFFAVVRQITVGEFLQHIEALVVALWIVSDFINICFISSATIKIAGETLKTNERQMILPYFALVIAVVPILGKTSKELEWLTEKLFVKANLILLYAIPFIMWLTLKIKEAIFNRRLEDK